MRKKIKYLAFLLSSVLLVSCGRNAKEQVKIEDANISESVESNTEASEDTEETTDTALSVDSALFPIAEWEKKWSAENDTKECYSTEKFDAEQYEEKVVKSRLDEAIKNSKSIADELKNVEEIAYYYTNYHNADLSQQDMNNVSCAESYIWDYEVQSLYNRILEEADDSRKDSIKAEQDAWKADFDRCYEAVKYVEGSWASMMNSELDSRFMKSRSYILARELADERGENIELPKRFFRENSYISDDAVLYIKEGMEGGSISITYAPKGKEKVDMLCYEPMINDTTISFKTTCEFDDGEVINTNDGDAPIVGIITYGWDGATLTITESGDKSLPAGTKVKFPKAM